MLVTLGYSAWGEGSWNPELAENSWLTVDADAAIIFDTPVGERYDRALGLLGLQSWMLSRDGARMSGCVRPGRRSRAFPILSGL